MKFTLSWLKQHLETEATLDEICAVLNDIGLEVEEVSDPASRIAAFRLGKVIKADQHPDADRLRVCQVATADGEKQIICGAPNARAGITVVVAEPGMYVPGIDTTIAVGKIRGVESHGMMASERELELSDEHNGIIELPSGEVGERFVDWLAQHEPARIDPVIEIAITPNRSDALGVHGIARDLAARGLGRLRPLEAPAIAGAFPCPVSIGIDDAARDVAPHFTGRVIRGVTNGPSPEWLQQRVRAIGLRPISALVDITNYFTFDQNRPLHVFDAAKIHGAGLRVHLAEGGETLTALDDKEYRFSPGQILISDAKGVESIAGVMGGLPSSVTEETTDVFLESAWWDPIRIAETGRALKINSDARYRFERGVDAAWTRPGLEAATAMILSLCGGEPSEVVEAGAPVQSDRHYRFDPERLQSLVGMTLDAADQRRILTDLGFRLEGDRAFPPPWRPDIQGEADLVEEIARIASLTHLEPQPLPLPPGIARPVLSAGQQRVARARRAAAARGLHEAVTYSFIDKDAATAFGGGDAARRLENPISSEMTEMRPDLLAGLLRAAARNQQRGHQDVALFEIGTAFHGGEPGESQTQIALLRIGATAPKDSHGSRRDVDLFDARADAEALLDALGAPERRGIFRIAPGWFHPGRAGCLGLGPKKILAQFGALHPKLLKNFDIKGPAVAVSLWPDQLPLPKTARATRAALQRADLQAVERDFAFVMDASVAAADLLNAAQGADKAMIEEVRLFDAFEGAPAEAALGAGKKSLAITVRLQPQDKTLTDKEIDAIGAAIIAKVNKATGAVLRG